LYFGEEEWDGAKDLHGIVDFTDIPDELRDMVPNYKIQLVQVRKLEDTSVFQTDVKQVFDFIRCSGDKEKLKQLVNSDAAYQDMEEDAYDMAAQYSGINEIIQAKENHYEKEGHVNMGNAVRKMIEEIREEGREEGREEEQEKTIDKLLSKGYTCEAIADMLDLDQEEIQRIRSKMLHLV
jgi:predicted transposase/invertase (TIGR01784 family)